MNRPPRLCAAALVAMLASFLGAGEAAPLPPDVVARIGERVITLRELENEMLRREGADAVLQWVQGHLEGMNWGELPDDAVVMSVGGHQLRRRELTASMLREIGAKVREELANIAVVETALAKAGVVIDDATLASEYRLMEREFQRKVAKAGQGYIDFASYLRVKEKMNSEQFLAQPAVRMLAGMHELVRRRLRSELDDARLTAKLEAERARWDIRAGVDLSVIHIPWKKNAQGQVTDEERASLQSAANSIVRDLQSKRVTFERAWDAFGKTWDSSGPNGRVGWVDHDGGRSEENARRIPKGLVDRAFACEGQLPVLLLPHAHEAGVDIALLHAKRGQRAVTLAEVREALIQDELERVIEARTKALVAELRTAATVEYASLPEQIRAAPSPVKP